MTKIERLFLFSNPLVFFTLLVVDLFTYQIDRIFDVHCNIRVALLEDEDSLISHSFNADKGVSEKGIFCFYDVFF